MKNITTEYEWENPDPDSEESVILTVEATITDDPGYPADGGEIEDITITGPDGKVWDNDTPTLVSKPVFDWKNGRIVPGSMRMEFVLVKIEDAVEDAIINASEDLAW